MGKRRIENSKIFSPEDFLSRGEVAEILGVTHATITRSIHEGYLPTVTIGGHEFVLRETLQTSIRIDKIASRLGVGKGD